MQLIPVHKRYVYEKLQRIDAPEGRVYVHPGEATRLPSVTSILSSTKDAKHLDSWAARIGPEEAERIKNDAATVGTHMHNVVERLLLNRDLPTPRTWLAVRGYWMGYKLIDTFFPHVQEVWGAEVMLYHPGLYAGTSDCVAVYKNNPSIIDFKQANKMKQRNWIEDYFLQLAAYAVAHNVKHGTDIDHGVVMMVDQTGATQEFVTCGREFSQYKDAWMRRVERFHKEKSSQADGQPVSP
jgi:genome maintenance exonuclease 1